MRNIALFFDVQRIHIGAQSDCTIAGLRAFELPMTPVRAIPRSTETPKDSRRPATSSAV
jgi:hypothetical protein